jgi:hypothetical protein
MPIQQRSQHQFLFRSCGPVMDPVLGDALELLDIPYQLVAAADCRSAHAASLPALHDFGQVNTVTLPRWDHTLLLASSRRDSRPPMRSARARLSRLRASILQVRRLFLGATPAAGTGSNDRVLLIERSPQPRYYDPDEGEARIRGYGTAKRSLCGLQRCRQHLSAAGIHCEIYQPGAHAFQHQVTTVANSRAMVGARGAEFANIVWMAPGSQVVMLQHESQPVNSPTRALAGLMGHSLEEITVSGATQIALDEAMIRRLSELVQTGIQIRQNQ